MSWSYQFDINALESFVNRLSERVDELEEKVATLEGRVEDASFIGIEDKSVTFVPRNRRIQ